MLTDLFPRLRKLQRFVPLLVISLILIFGSGCAVGNKHQYAGAAPNLMVETSYATAVAVQDQRSYVLDGGKSASFVGVQRGGFGNPFDVTTESGKALASDMCETIVAALKRKNVAATLMDIPQKATDTDAKQLMLTVPADRLLLFKLIEWKADTYQNTALMYDVRLSVFDSAGTLMAENARQGRDDLGGSFMNPPAHAKTAVPSAFRRIFESLLNEPRVLAALGETD
jgi:hypothetical protein